MATKYDKRQDARIKENSDDIRLVREYLKELHDHFLPEAEERRFKRVRKYVLGLIAKIVAAVLFVLGLWDVLGWYIDRLEIKGMARRYAEVAEKVYYSENNPEVAGDFLDKAIELEGDDPEKRFRAHSHGHGPVGRRRRCGCGRIVGSGAGIESAVQVGVALEGCDRDGLQERRCGCQEMLCQGA